MKYFFHPIFIPRNIFNNFPLSLFLSTPICKLLDHKTNEEHQAASIRDYRESGLTLKKIILCRQTQPSIFNILALHLSKHERASVSQ